MTHPKLKEQDALEGFARLSGTRHPYWIKAEECAQVVEIRLLSECSDLRSTIARSCPKFTPTPGLCFENSFRLADCLESVGAKYVEGFSIRDNRFNSHAWISYRSEYFDLTYEHSYNLPQNRSSLDWREGCSHVAMIEMSASSLRSVIGFDGYQVFDDGDSPNVPPFANQLWQIPSVFPDQFAITASPLELLLMQYSNPDFHPSNASPIQNELDLNSLDLANFR